MSGDVSKKFQLMANFTMPNNSCSMKYALKSVPALADVGVPHGVEDGPRITPRCVGRAWKKFQMTNFTMPNNVSSIKYSLKSVPGLADVWVPHGVEDGPRTLAPGSGSKMYAYHVDQHEKLKGLGRSKAT